MKVKLGYPDRIVEFDGKRVYVFKGRLFSAPLEKVISYYLHGDEPLAPAIRSVVSDVVRFLLNTGELQYTPSAAVESAQKTSS